MVYLTVDNAYASLCEQLLVAPQIGNTKELNNVCVQIHNTNDAIVSIRDISVTYLFGELLWYFTGRDDLEFISKFSTFWAHLSDDGKTCNSAYGALAMWKYGFNQIDTIIALLRRDPNSRRAVINLNVPNPRVIETKDEPCTLNLQFLIRNGKLLCTTCMRSNDIWFGFPYDVAFFTELQKYIAFRLDLVPGLYTHFVGSMHMYDRDEGKIAHVVSHLDQKHVEFNRLNFHTYKHRIADRVCAAEDPKAELLTALAEYGVYGGIENE